MPVFTTQDDFKKFDIYKKNLNKVAGHVNASGKVFIYFKEFQFADRKQPLMLIDVPIALKNELLKGAVKPTASGMVTLTDSNELKFDADRGTLNRAKVKTALAKIGIDNVYVSPGDVDDESETQPRTPPPPVVSGAQNPSPPKTPTTQTPGTPANLGGQPKTNPVAPQNALPPLGHQAPQTATSKTALPPLNKIPDLKPITGPGSSAQPRPSVLPTLGQKPADVGIQNQNLPNLPPLSKAAKSVPGPAPGADGFRPRWLAARKSWQDASDAVDAQIARLQQALRKSGDTELKEIAEFGLNAVTGNHKVRLMAAIKDIDAADALARAAAAQKASAEVAAFQRHLESDARVAVCDENPFGVPMTIRSSIGGALADLLKALGAA
jgi:hypothetical protein